jgi:hypothetical protein
MQDGMGCAGIAIRESLRDDSRMAILFVLARLKIVHTIEAYRKIGPGLIFTKQASSEF